MSTADRRPVLIVEDDAATSELERRALARAGTNAVIVSGVKDALELLETQSFAAILLDYRLPDGDPWAVVEAAESKHPRIPVILVTGEGNELIASEAIHRGVAHYLKKSGTFWEQLPGIVDRVSLLASSEERLRESEERFRGAFEFAAIGMALVGPDGRFLRVNEAVCRILGYSVEELLATTFGAITHPDDLERDTAYARQLLDGSISHCQMEKRYFHKDGHIVWVLLSASLVHDSSGQPSYFVSQLQDITEQRQLTDELRIARADLRAILDNVPARITAWHANLSNHFANQIAAAHFGISAADAVGKHIRAVIGEDRYAGAKPSIDAALAGQQQSYQQIDAQPDGSMRYSHVEFVPKRSDGEVIGLYALATDVTELRESYHRIRELAQRLETIREDERRSIAQVLHEGIAQDLFAIFLGVDRLRAQAVDHPDMTKACQDLAEAISKCMDATRQIANELRPTMLAHVPVSAALRDHARFFAGLSGLNIRVSEIASVPTLDETTGLVLFRAAQEALTNVARHAQASCVDIVLGADSKSITMDITDDGVGIDDAALEKAGSYGLLGIRERVDALGGALLLRKNPVAGTTVSVQLPRNEESDGL